MAIFCNESSSNVIQLRMYKIINLLKEHMKREIWPKTTITEDLIFSVNQISCQQKIIWEYKIISNTNCDSLRIIAEEVAKNLNVDLIKLSIRDKLLSFRVHEYLSLLI